MENNVIANTTDIVGGLTNAAEGLFVSFEAKTIDEKKRLYKATSNGSPISDVKNKVLELVDVVVIPTDVVNQDGTTVSVPRTTLICKDGGMYTASSWGVYNSLRRMYAIFGTLHFEEPLKISAVDVKTKAGSTINITIV